MEFKITDINGWGGREVGSSWLGGNGFSQTNFLDYVEAGNGGNIRLIQDGEYTIYWNKGTTANNVCADIGIERSDISTYDPHTYTLVGNKLPSAWDPSDTNYDFALTNGNKTATYTGDFVAGDQFKIAEDHSWGVSYGFANATSCASEVINNGGNFFVKTSGNYTITINTNDNYQLSTLVVTKNSQLPYRSYSLVGNWDEWDTKCETYVFPSLSSKSAYLDVTFEANVEFKVVVDFAWDVEYGYNASYVTAVSSQVIGNEGNFKIAIAGTYRITINLNNDYSFKNIAITDNAVYKVTVGATDYALTLNSGTEYQTEAIALTAGQSISVKRGETNRK